MQMSLGSIFAGRVPEEFKLLFRCGFSFFFRDDFNKLKYQQGHLFCAVLRCAKLNDTHRLATNVLTYSNLMLFRWLHAK